MPRKLMDCRDHPSEKKCTLVISGEEGEVLRAAVSHAIEVHGEQDSPKLREMIQGSLKDEPPVLSQPQRIVPAA